MRKCSSGTCARNCPAVISVSDLAGCCSAALLTRMSSRPKRRIVRRIARRQKGSCPMSPGTRRHSWPVSSTSSAVVRASSCSLQIHDRDIGAFAGEGNRHRLADAAIAAGDERDAAGQTFAGRRLRANRLGLAGACGFRDRVARR